MILIDIIVDFSERLPKFCEILSELRGKVRIVINKLICKQ